MRRGLAVVVVAVLLPGCAGIPTGGRVRVIRKVQADGPEPPEPRVIRKPVGPHPGDSPATIVLNFLAAQADVDGDHAIARKYLAARAPWNPSANVTVYGQRQVGTAAVAGGAATVPVTLQRVGGIGSTGEFRAAAGPATYPVRLRLVPGVGWRIAEAPAGVLLSAADLQNAYDRETVYFADPTRRHVVPAPLFLPSGAQRSPGVMGALLAGPSGWLAAAVRTAVPARTELLDPPTLLDGVLTLNFSREIRSGPDEQLAVAVAQIVWTATEPALGATGGVRLLVEGASLNVPGQPRVRVQTRDRWLGYAPVAAAAEQRLFFLRDGQPYADGATGAVHVATTPPLLSFAVSRDGRYLAGVTVAAHGRRALVVVPLAGSRTPSVRWTADAFTPPAWRPDGAAVWTVATSAGRQRVLAVPLRGAVVPVAADLPPGGATLLRLAPDLARAVVVARGSAYVLRVERATDGRLRLADPRLVAPALSAVTAVTYGSPVQVFAVAAGPAGRGVYHLDVDGFGLSPVSLAGLPSAGVVTAVTAPPDPPVTLVAAVGGRLYLRPATSRALWTRLAPIGTVPAFAG